MPIRIRNGSRNVTEEGFARWGQLLAVKIIERGNLWGQILNGMIHHAQKKTGLEKLQTGLESQLAMITPAICRL